MRDTTSPLPPFKTLGQAAAAVVDKLAPPNDPFACTTQALRDMVKAMDAAVRATNRLRAAHPARMVDATKYAADIASVNFYAAYMMADAIATTFKRHQERGHEAHGKEIRSAETVIPAQTRIHGEPR